MKGFTDIHQHLLFGMDDGPDSFPRTVAMMRKAWENGAVRIIVTPHVSPGLKPFNYRRYMRKLRLVQDFCEENRIPMEIYGGAEIMYTPMTPSMLAEGKIPTLADTAYVLIEFPAKVAYKDIQRASRRLTAYGYRPILAHVERYKCLMRRTSRMYDLKEDYDVRYQMDCETVLKPKGFFVSRAVRKMLEGEMIDYVASNAHNTKSRRVRMEDTYRKLRREYGRTYADYLTGHGTDMDLD